MEGPACRRQGADGGGSRTDPARATRARARHSVALGTHAWACAEAPMATSVQRGRSSRGGRRPRLGVGAREARALGDGGSVLHDGEVGEEAAGREGRIQRGHREAPEVAGAGGAVDQRVCVAVRISRRGEPRRRRRRRTDRSCVMRFSAGGGGSLSAVSMRVRGIAMIPMSRRRRVTHLMPTIVHSHGVPIRRVLVIGGRSRGGVMRRPQVPVRHPVGQRRARSREAREQRQGHCADARAEMMGVGHAPMYPDCVGAIAGGGGAGTVRRAAPCR